MIFNKEDYQKLEQAYLNTEFISNGAPDRYQYFQNELSKTIAGLLLKGNNQNEVHMITVKSGEDEFHFEEEGITLNVSEGNLQVISMHSIPLRVIAHFKTWDYYRII